MFEEFADQRRNSFLAIKKLKDEGTPVVGVFCTYLPKEIANAMGAAVVGLCSVSDETIPDAEKDLPRNLCPLIKSSYGFAKTDKCPFFYFSDLVVGETTCDGKKKMYELLSGGTPVILNCVETYNNNIGHTVTVIGIRNGADPNNLTYADFLIVDPADGAVKTLQEMNNSRHVIIDDNSGWNLKIPK